MNIHLQNNSTSILRGVIMAGWKYGMKTGSYYIRSRPAVSAMKNNIAISKKLEIESAPVCYDKDNCESCSA